MQALTNAHAETRLLLPVTGAENRKDQLLLKLNAKVGQRLTVRPDQLYLRESPRPTLNRFLLRTDTESADPALLTWTPQLEGMTVTPRTVKSKSSLLVTLTLTPQAVKTWLAQPEASLSFAYTNHAPAIIRVLPAWKTMLMPARRKRKKRSNPPRCVRPPTGMEHVERPTPNSELRMQKH